MSWQKAVEISAYETDSERFRRDEPEVAMTPVSNLLRDNPT